MFATLRILVAVLAAFAFVVFVSRAQSSMAQDPLLAFVTHYQDVPKVFGAIFGVGVWVLLGTGK